MEKICKFCKIEKQIDCFFCAPNGSAASHSGTSTYCKDCHGSGLIEYGYGWYGKNKYTQPEIF